MSLALQFTRFVIDLKILKTEIKIRVLPEQTLSKKTKCLKFEHYLYGKRYKLESI